MTGLTRTLARFVVDTRLADLSEPVRHTGRRAFVNWLGCVLGGCREEVVLRAGETFAAFAGPPQSTVAGSRRRLDAPTAALLNTTANFAHGYNDTHEATVAHPSGAAASAAFAQGERQGSDGATVLLGALLGAEVACRIACLIAAPPARSHVGLSVHGVSNAFGAAAATGKVLGLDEDRMVWALGLAALQAAGLRSGYGTMGTKFIAGHAARCGMMAAFLARDGFTCTEAAIEDPKGFAAVFANPANPQAAVAGLGEHFELMQVAFKPWPCGVVIFPAIEACLQFAAVHRSIIDRVERVALRVHPLTLQLCDRPQPVNRIQALTSLQHWVAVSLLHGAAGLMQGTDASVRDERVAGLRNRVTAQADPALSPTAAVLQVHMANGEVHTISVADYQGSLSQPLGDRGLDDKFMNQALLHLPQATAAALLQKSWAIAELPDLGSFSGPLQF